MNIILRRIFYLWSISISMTQPDSDDGRTDPNFLFVSFSPFLTFFGSLRSGWVVVVTPSLSESSANPHFLLVQTERRQL